MKAELERLRQERETTLREIERMRAALFYEVDTEEDEADPDLFERDKTMALIQALERKVEEIDYALRTADRGTYGICERCGQKIDPARLKALPETTLCVSCKSELERRNRRARGAARY